MCSGYLQEIKVTSDVVSFVVDVVLVASSNLLVMTVRVMRGSATESRLLPYTVTAVPPLNKFIEIIDTEFIHSTMQIWQLLL